MREHAKKSESPSRTLESNPKASRQAPIDVILQQYTDRNIQRYAEDEGSIQGKFNTVQREETDKNELLQGKFESVPAGEQKLAQREEKPNNTGLPDNLKSGIENLSGYNMDDVRVHYNSSKPAQLNALAYAQGTDIHVAPGQEKHLPHEAWHVVQQKQGRVQPTMQMQGLSVNDNVELEKEADVMGNEVMQQKQIINTANNYNTKSNVIQRAIGFEFETGWIVKIAKNKESPPKGYEICDNDGYNIVADEAGEGLSEIEFVTIPFNDKSELKNAMETMKSQALDFIDFMQSSTNTDRSFEWAGFEIIPNQEDVKKHTMQAGPQVTFGIDLDQIELLEVSLNRKSIDSIDNSWPSYMGLIALIISYIQQDATEKIKGMDDQGKFNFALDYPKMITDSFLLARTDFVKLFSLAEEKDGKISKNKWRDLIDEKLPPNTKITTKLFSRGIKDDGLHVRYPTLTIKEWIEGIYDGTDHLTKERDCESMGSLKDRTEIYDGEDVGIFEYRGAQRTKLELNEWEQFALKWAETISTLPHLDKRN